MKQRTMRRRIGRDTKKEENDEKQKRKCVEKEEGE
jgi:hypothetical protein